MILDKLLLATAIVGSLAAVINIVGVNCYDVRQVKTRRQRLLHPYSKRNRNRPMVSVIVVTRNDEDVITDCLESLLRSNYRKLEIVVADNGSGDSTKKLVRDFMAANPKKRIKLYAKRQAGERLKAITYAAKRYVRGEVVMLLENAGCVVDRRAIFNAVMQLNAEDRPGPLSVNYKVRPAFKTAGLFQEFDLLLRNRIKKMASVFKLGVLTDGRSAMIYSREVLDELLRSRSLGLPSSAYAADAVVYGQAQSFRGLVQERYRSGSMHVRDFTWPYLLYASIFGLTGLVMPVLLTYFTYLAINLRQPDFLMASWAVLGTFLLFAIWEDEQLRLKQKLKYIFLMPISYGWFYLMSFTRYCVLLTSFRAAPRSSTGPAKS